MLLRRWCPGSSVRIATAVHQSVTLGQADATPEPCGMLSRSPGNDLGRGRARRPSLEIGMSGSECLYGRLARGLVQPAGLALAAIARMVSGSYPGFGTAYIA